MTQDDNCMSISFQSMVSIILDAEHRLVLYYLANNNPRVDEEKLAIGTSLSSERIREILSNLQTAQLAKFEPGHGYTLTEKGLASLYNYHATITKKKP